MSLEKVIEENTKAVLLLVEKLSGQMSLPLEPTDAPAPSKQEDQPSKEDVMEALSKLADTKGAKAAKEVLKNMGFSRLSEVPEDKYAELLKVAS